MSAESAARKLAASNESAAGRLAASPPEVKWQGAQLRIFMPAAKLYGRGWGGSVSLLTPEAARQLAEQILDTLGRSA